MKKVFKVYDIVNYMRADGLFIILGSKEMGCKTNDICIYPKEGYDFIIRPIEGYELIHVKESTLVCPDSVLATY